MSGERRTAAGRSGADPLIAELRAREAVIASMDAALRELHLIGPFHPSRLVLWSHRLCDVQSRRASDAFGAESQEATRASVLTALADRRWEEWQEMGYVNLYESRQHPSAHIRRAIARLSDVDLPLALLRPDLAEVEDEVAHALFFPFDDDDVESAVDRARSVLDDGIPAVSDCDFAAWESAIWLVSAWIDDMTSRVSPLIDAEVAMVDLLRATHTSDFSLLAEAEELEMYIEEVRSTVPGPEGSQSLEARQRHILTRLRADSAFDAVGPLRALLVQASAERMDDGRRITLVWGVERDIAELYRDSGDLAKASELASRSLQRLLDYMRAGSYDFSELRELVLSDMEFRIQLIGQQGDFDGVVRAVNEVFDWVHQIPDYLSFGLSERERVVANVLEFIESAPEAVAHLQAFDDLVDAVYSVYPEERPDRLDDEDPEG